MADEPGDEPPAEDPKYNQDFFLALAAKGKDAWNVWRRDPANKNVRVTFAGIDFSEALRDEIDFSGFQFGDYADFSQCKWRGVNSFEAAAFGDGARFEGAAFGDDGARFAGAAFGDGARFAGAAFGNLAIFADAAFGNNARFDGAAFGDWARFEGATTFGDDARFAGAAFGAWASFAGAVFGNGAYFAGAAFGYDASFADTVFKGRADFTGKSEEQWVRDVASKLGLDAEARAALEKRHKDSRETNGSRLDRFLTISFSRGQFDGVAVFSGRSFEKTANFTNSRFYSPPDFEFCGGTARINFTGAHIGFVPPGKRPWTGDSEIPVRLRAFRKVAEETKNHDLERDLYIEERKAERGVYLNQLLELDELDKKLRDVTEQKKYVWLEWRLQRRARNAHWLEILAKHDKIARLIAHLFWIAVMGVYWALADYGRSFARPFAWLIASVFFFYWRYLAILTPLMAKAGAPDLDKYKQALRMLALGNAVPFVGPLTIDTKIKEFLFCPSNAASCLPPIPPEGFQVLVIAQNLFSITCVFFIGLALRNYFRIK